MGVAYLAHNNLLGRDEVLKVMGRQIMERPGVLERFLREIRAVAKLRHPNIVTAYHATRVGESIIFAMEYVDGLDLSRTVKAKGPLPVAHACSFAYQAALGLQHAHEEGLVHRDIKPGNLMLARKGAKATIKILDFGLAKATREEKVDGGLTSEGQALGTPDYIAPEQILDASRADIRADIYSLGGTLYYLLAGRRPFQASSLYDMYQAHISRDADPLNLVRPEAPLELAVLVAKMMAKDPARRFQTPGEIAQALQPFFSTAASQPQPPRLEQSLVISQVDQNRIAQKAAASMRAPASAEPKARTQKTVSQSVGDAMAWDSLIHVHKDEPFISPEKAEPGPPPLVAPVRTRPRASLRVVLRAAGVILSLIGGIVIGITTQKRETNITANDDVPTKLKGSGFTVGRTVMPESKAVGHRNDAPDSIPADKPITKIGSRPWSGFTNSIGIKLRLIPAGEFMMGSDAADPDAGEDEFVDAAAGKKDKHRVRITKSFYLGITEVTRGQFRRFVDDAGYQTEAEKDGRGGLGWNEATKRLEKHPRYTWQNAGFKQTDEHPVVNVSWNDAVAMANWLSQKDGKTYRLPTEAEREYACRAGTTSRYSCGDDPQELAAVGNVGDATLKAAVPHWNAPTISTHDGYVHTAPAGRYNANPWGLLDMHGNVWEWCSDWLAGDYYEQSPVDDPENTVDATLRVCRGGAWTSKPRGARSAGRGRFAPEDRRSDLGFRLARELSGG